MNTALESLSYGVPMVAIPITNDQPGVAARIAYTGTGEAIPLKKLNSDDLRKAIESVLTQDSYRQAALKMKEHIQQSGGVSRAADIVEAAISSKNPVIQWVNL
jgi:zeaxanthin glucosyltransferase